MGNFETTMRTVEGRTWIKTEAIPDDTFKGETKEQYMQRIRTKYGVN